MREIKFRIRLVNRHTGVKEKIHVPLYNEGNGLMQFPVDLTEWEVVGNDQCTGLVDRNGKEIYEGDIIVFGINSIRTIKFDRGSFTLFDGDSRRSPLSDYVVDRTIEVLGNIYEHPELLEDP